MAATAAILSAQLLAAAPTDVDVVVTEHGSADLRGQSLTERARALKAIADPEHLSGLG